MGNLVILLAKDTPNVDGVPPEWPVESRDIGDSIEIPPDLVADGRNWQVVTQEQFDQRLEDNKTAKEIFNAIVDAVNKTEQRFLKSEVIRVLDVLKGDAKTHIDDVIVEFNKDYVEIPPK